jgi:hypothetical protein
MLYPESIPAHRQKFMASFPKESTFIAQKDEEEV